MFGIIGRSGAGKAHYLRTLNQLERPTEGSLHFTTGATCWQSTPPNCACARRIGMIFSISTCSPHVPSLETSPYHSNLPVWIKRASGRGLMKLIELGRTKRSATATRHRSAAARNSASASKTPWPPETARSALWRSHLGAEPETRLQSILELLADINRFAQPDHRADYQWYKPHLQHRKKMLWQ